MAARANGPNVPTSATSNRNLAIQRCIRTLMQSKLNKVQVPIATTGWKILSQQHIGATVGEGDGEVYENKNQIVMPA